MLAVRAANFSHRSPLGRGELPKTLRACIAATRRGSGRFHQVFSRSGGGENLVDRGGRGARSRLATRHTYTPPSCRSYPPSLSPSPLPCRRSRINYARYLHTKRPGKIKNTNSERAGGTPGGPHLVRSLIPSSATLRAALSLPRSLSLPLVLRAPRASTIYRPCCLPRSGTDAIAL